MNVPTMPEIYYPKQFAFAELFCGMTINSPYKMGFDMRETAVQKEFAQAINPLVLRVLPKQIHSKTVHRVEDESSSIDDGDGLVTKRYGLVLGVRVADCCGIVLFDRRQQVVSVLHAGWRGCACNIAAGGVASMQNNYASTPADIYAHIFPAASVAAYEVGKDVAESFSYPKSYQHRDGKYYLDMHSILTHQLLETGLLDAHITRSQDCTITNIKYHSYRRDGKNYKCMLVFAGMKGNK